MNSYEKIFQQFKKNGIKYVIIGGVAVNLYGYSRFTGDIDIIVEESMEFEKYYRRKNIIKVWNIGLPVCHIDDLIKMKKAVGRDKDLLDLEALLKLKSL